MVFRAFYKNEITSFGVKEVSVIGEERAQLNKQTRLRAQNWTIGSSGTHMARDPNSQVRPFQ
jgi:hypothetical protein